MSMSAILNWVPFYAADGSENPLPAYLQNLTASQLASNEDLIAHLHAPEADKLTAVQEVEALFAEVSGKRPGDVGAEDIFGTVVQDLGDAVNDVEVDSAPEAEVDIDSVIASVEVAAAERIEAQATLTEAQYLAEFDTKYFLSFHGAHLYVFGQEEEDGRKTLGRYADSAWVKYRSNLTVRKVDERNNIKDVPVAPLWLKTTSRRYEKIVFNPANTHKAHEYNLWKGFGISRQPYDPEDIKFITEGLILGQLCAGDQTNADYLIKWLAHGVQFPAIKPQVAIVLRGAEGTGKGTLGNKIWVPIWGEHGITMSHSRHLTGNFNAHMRTSVGVFSDEAQYVGDSAGNQALKALITEDFNLVEAKGIDADLKRNYLKVIMATNSEWAINAGPDARRFFVLDVSEQMAGVRTDEKELFWGTINKYLSNGGVAQFLDYLLKIDLTGFNPARFPETEALKGQREFSLDPTTCTVINAIMTGKFTYGTRFIESGLEIDKVDVRKSVEDFCRSSNLHRNQWPSDNIISKRLLALGVKSGRRSDASRARTYTFPPIGVLERKIIEVNKLRDNFFSDDE